MLGALVPQFCLKGWVFLWLLNGVLTLGHGSSGSISCGVDIGLEGG